jgi:hypothetical protein
VRLTEQVELWVRVVPLWVDSHRVNIILGAHSLLQICAHELPAPQYSARVLYESYSYIYCRRAMLTC